MHVNKIHGFKIKRHFSRGKEFYKKIGEKGNLGVIKLDLSRKMLFKLFKFIKML